MTSLLSITLFAPSINHLNNEKYMLLKNNIIFKLKILKGFSIILNLIKEII